MNERLLDKKLRKGIAACAVIGIAVIGLAAVLLMAMQSSLEQIVIQDMETEALEYRRRILRQVDKEYQAIETLAAVFAHGDMTDSEWFDQCLYDANEKNGFTTMSYFNRDGIGTLVYTGKIKKNVNYRDLNENIRIPVEKALKGQKNVSRLFRSEHLSEMIFAYSVPVYNLSGNDIIGVLLVGSTVDTFSESIGCEGQLKGKHAVHLMSGSGKMLLSNSFKDMSGIPEDSFHEPSYFTEEEQEGIDRALARQEALSTHMKFRGKDYKVYLTPVGINGWYVMYVNNEAGVNLTAYRMVNIMGAAFMLLLAVILFMLVHTCRLIAINNRELKRLAYQDSLTRADNMIRFYQRLDGVRQQDDGFCLVAFNIRHFKFINEIFGVKAADRFLCRISKNLELFIKEKEFFCRDGGDTFYLCLNKTRESVIKNRVEEILDSIREQKISEKADYQILVYAGALICAKHTERMPSNELLVTRVRFAMQSCKKFPSERVHFYDVDIHKNEEMENYVETHMHQALQQGEFKMFLQPKILLEDGKLGGAEALVRWITEDGKMIFPDDFIPQFERNGFCVQLDLYMVEQACRQIRFWMDRGISPIPISVNQSKLLFFDAEYLDCLKELLRKYRIPAHLITLEILEGLAVEHLEEINEKLRGLREMGFRISMDDFGTGYSSFHALGNLEIDELKLDRSFLLEASEDKENRFCTIMEHIVELTKSLHISTVAEGVETLENEEMIKNVGCDFGQGYLYSRPISAKEFSKKYMNLEQ